MNCTIREFNAVDGYFVLISDANGDLFAKAYDQEKAKLIAAAPKLLNAAQECLKLMEAKLHVTDCSWDEQAAIRRLHLAIAEASPYQRAIDYAIAAGDAIVAAESRCQKCGNRLGLSESRSGSPE